ncbi:MAG: hypothetical protein AAB676_15860 [Verrucomicrobiota bacterium]
MPASTPTIYLIAGCNGAGKTTFAGEFLPTEVKCVRFLNADEIARGLSPFNPSASAVKAARLLLQAVHGDIRRQQTFALETTLSGKTYIRLFRQARRLGLEIELHYTSGFPAPRKPSPACVSGCAWADTTFPPPTFAAVSNAASSTCSTTTFPWPAAGPFGTAADCPQNGSPVPPRMILNLCDT